MIDGRSRRSDFPLRQSSSSRTTQTPRIINLLFVATVPTSRRLLYYFVIIYYTQSPRVYIIIIVTIIIVVVVVVVLDVYYIIIYATADNKPIYTIEYSTSSYASVGVRLPPFALGIEIRIHYFRVVIRRHRGCSRAAHYIIIFLEQ